MSEYDESVLSDSGHVYTHFNSSYQGSDVELSSTIGDKSVEEDDRPSKCSKLKPFILRCCEVFLLLVLIIIVWLALAVPSVFFAISQVEDSNSSNGSNTSCTLTAEDTCTPTQYVPGGICEDYLKSYQSCLPYFDGRVIEGVYIPSCIDQAAVEKKLRLVDQFLPWLSPSPECVDTLKPVACLYYFGLCDKGTKTVIIPTKKQCVSLKTTVCKSVWNIAMGIEAVRSQLPDCDSLPNTEPMSCSGHVPFSSISPRLDCSPTFYFDSNLSNCKPECGQWTPYSDIENHVSDVVVIISGAIAIISGSAVLIFSCVRCKEVFSYPSVFIVYQTIPTILLGGLVLIAYIDRTGLFCSSRSVLASFNNPTTFCKLTGIFLYYITMQLLILWLFHVMSMFWGIFWPIQASMVKASPKRIVLHIFAVCLAIFLPVIPVLIIQFMAPGGFTITRFPPILCAARSVTFNFYAFMLPVSIIIACGLTLLVLIFWKLLKKRILHHVRKTRIDTHWCTHARILTVLCYFVIFGIVVVSTFTVATINLDMFTTKIIKYFGCEASGITNTTSGVSECADEREALGDVINPITTIIALVVLGFYPAVNLVYVFHFKEVKENCVCCCRATREVEYTPRGNRPYSTVYSSSNGSASIQGVRLDTHGLIN